MLSRDDKMKFVANLAIELTKQNEKLTGAELVEILNRNEIKTSYGLSYRGGRGVYKLIAKAYAYFDALGLSQERDAIQDRFTNAQGKPAYLT